MKKSLPFENTLYVLSMILSLAFVSLIILSLAIIPLWAGERIETNQNTKASGRFEEGFRS